MTQQNNEFEKWWKKTVNTIEFGLWKNKYPDNTWQYTNHTTNLAWITWQAAKADSERQTGKMVRDISLAADAREAALENEIAELKADNETLVSVNNKLSNEILEVAEMYEARIDHLDAHINDLREALHKIRGCDCSTETNQLVKQALSSTPAQSLVLHDAQLIDKVITILDGIDQFELDHPNGYWETSKGVKFGESVLKEIRALKGKL